MIQKLDSTLSNLTYNERRELRERIIDAINEQQFPARNCLFYGPEVTQEMINATAYELTVLNWDLCTDMAGSPHVFDEWWLTRNTDIV